MSSYAIPQPDEVSVRDKEDAMGAYLMVFGALHIGLPLPFLSLIASWIYHGINGKKSTFVRFHTFQSLLFSIPSSIISTAWLVWTVVVVVDAFKHVPLGNSLTPYWVFTVFSVLVYLVYLVYCIVGAVQSRKGRLTYFPFFGRIAFAHSFGPTRQARPAPSNQPPKGFE